ncbi:MULTISPECIES: ProQ/FINO family protein [Cobetia]|uniref:ProQ/FINO family protein n=1 Tax=Cobetia TaxID=204286 RepID=UPI001F0CEE91|nr:MULTISPECIES: ProQ/FINO family protein [Cobetia]
MDRLEALYSALEHEADTQRQQRDGERQARLALESENAQLRETLAALRQQMQEQQAQLTGLSEALMARDAELRELRERSAQSPASQPVEDARPSAAQVEAAAEQLASASESPGVASGETADAESAPSPAMSNDAPVESAGSDETPDQATPPSPQALLKQWYKRYPDTFFKGHTRPLKIGIHVELLENEPWDEKLVRRALAGYVHLPRYLKAVRAGTQRVDLEGQSVGAVTEDEALHARQQLAELTRQQKEREEQAASQRISHKLSELMTKHR